MRDVSLEKTHRIRFEISQSFTAYVKFHIMNFGTIFVTRIIWLLQIWHLNTNGFCTVLWTTSPQNSGIQLLSLLGVSQGWSHVHRQSCILFWDSRGECSKVHSSLLPMSSVSLFFSTSLWLHPEKCIYFYTLTWLDWAYQNDPG